MEKSLLCKMCMPLLKSLTPQIDVLSLVAILKLGTSPAAAAPGGSGGMELRLGLGFVGPPCPGSAAGAASFNPTKGSAFQDSGSAGSGFWELQSGESLLSEDADPRYRRYSISAFAAIRTDFCCVEVQVAAHTAQNWSTQKPAGQIRNDQILSE